MLKKALFSMVLLGMLVAPLFAQSNVEKALRFRAKAPNPEVVVQSDGSPRSEQTKETQRVQALLKGSSAQLRDLGGYIWANSEGQLKDLGCSYCSRGHQFSAGQLEDLGPSGRTWVFTAGQLEDLGGFIWNNSSTQLKDLGCPWCSRGHQFSAGQLVDLGPTVRPRVFSAGQLEDLGQSRYAVGRSH